jgi:hypothetical protein
MHRTLTGNLDVTRKAVPLHDEADLIAGYLLPVTV